MDSDLVGFAFAFLLIGGIILFFAVKIGQSTAGVRRQREIDDASPVLSAPARVVTKRTETYGDPARTDYHATFELDSGERREYRMKGEEYGLLAEGDRGELTHQGTRYKGFARTLVRAASV